MTLNRDIGFQQTTARAERTGRPALIRVAIGIASTFSIAGMFVSGSPLAVVATGLTFVALILLLWQPDDLPILLMPAMYQWSEVAVKPILTVISGKPIDRVLDLGFRLQTGSEAAALFGFAGVTCLGFGMWIGARGLRVDAARAVQIEARRWARALVLRLSLAAIILGHAAATFAGLAGPALQLVLAFAALEYAGVFGLAYWCFINQTGYFYLLAVMAFEIALGLTGFFADFRGPVLMLALAVLAARPTFRLSSILIVTSVAAVILCLAVFWSEVKDDYRSFANEGVGGQVAVQPLEARLGFIYGAAVQFDGDQFADGFDRLLARFSYIDFLGATLANVPRFVPHEDGGLLGAAVANMLMPRVLFPNKPPLPSDTEITGRYTGVSMGNTAATSISIGYLGELYIDFGYIGALAAATILGVAIGVLFRLLRDYDRVPRLINYGLCAALTLPFTDFGTALVKIINGVVLVFMAALITQRLIAPRVLALYITRYNGNRSGQSRPAVTGRSK